ncbi:hypothetical protein CF319_g8679 [Tilletia indica]|nr:hypothetical protein CF319_g8679 [Tilletia indica]
MPPTRKLSQWQHFYSIDADVDNLRVQYNKAYKSAWCKYCVHKIMEDDDITKIQAMVVVKAVSGEKDKLHSHLKQCEAARFRLANLSDCGLPNYGAHIKEVAEPQARQVTLSLVRSQHGLTKAEQAAFDLDFTTATYAAGIAAEAFDAPLLRECMLKWFKVELPSASVARGRLLTTAVTKVRGDLHDLAQGREATLCIDTWNSPRGDHIMGSVICLPGSSAVLPVHIVDTTEERHTGAACLLHLKAALALSEGPRLEARITAVCTDAGPDCASARRLLLAELPHLVSIHCFAHQVNLLVSDVLKASPTLKTTYVTMLQIVDWFRTHLVARGILRRYRRNNGDPPLELKRPATTRWTSAFTTASRLKKLRDSIEGSVISKRQELEVAAGKRPDAVAKAKEILRHVRGGSFWSALDDLIAVLEPLAIAAQVAQTNLCRLDSALLTFGKLYTQYRMIIGNPGTGVTLKAACTKLCAALNRRWLSCDQSIWMVALVLNPFFGRKLVALSLEGMEMNHAAFFHQILAPAYDRLFSKGDAIPTQDEKDVLFKDWVSYSNADGHFSDSYFSIKQRLDVKDHNPVTLWQEWGSSGWASRPIAKLALHVLRMTPSAAGCERLFSSFLDISDKKRNRILPHKMADIATIKMADRNKRAATSQASASSRKAAKRIKHGDEALYSCYNLEQQNRQDQAARQNEDEEDLEEAIFNAASNPDAWQRITRDWLENMGEADFSDDALRGSSDQPSTTKFSLAQIFKMEGFLDLEALQNQAAPWTDGQDFLEEQEREEEEANEIDLLADENEEEEEDVVLME